MLFEYLKSITCTKNDKLLLEEYVPFLITRWLSFGVTESTSALNKTVNSLGNIDKETHFKLLIKLFPKFKYQPKFNYIKKLKTENEKNEKIDIISRNMEISKREVLEYFKTVDNKTDT